MILSTIHRTDILAWCRQHAPDLRIGYALAEDGVTRSAYARMTLGEETVTLEAQDDDEIARVVYRAICAYFRFDTEGHIARAMGIREQEIFEAALSSDPTESKRLARALAQDSVKAQAKNSRNRWRAPWRM